jgi:hypothetical protein
MGWCAARLCLGGQSLDFCAPSHFFDIYVSMILLVLSNIFLNMK